ncbi:MAG: hypothetical protein ACK4NA_05945 [Alphaproteobacteria bacterium]
MPMKALALNYTLKSGGASSPTDKLLGELLRPAAPDRLSRRKISLCSVGAFCGRTERWLKRL